MTRPHLPARPTLAECEYLVRRWLTEQLWGTGHIGRVFRRIVVEYDRRGAELGEPGRILPAASAAADVVDDVAPPDVGPPDYCHDGRKRLQCGRCRSLDELDAPPQ